MLPPLRGAAAAHAGKRQAWTVDVRSVLCLGFCSRPQRLSGALPEMWVRVGSGWDGVQLVSLVSVVFGKAVALPSRIRRFVPSRVLYAYMFVPHSQPAPPSVSFHILLVLLPARFCEPFGLGASTSVSAPLHPTPLTAQSTLRPGHSDRRAYSSCYVTPLRFP